MSAVAVDQPTKKQSLIFSLLRLLEDGEFHSGEVLAQQLGISRASVSNALRGVSSYGLSLYSVRGRGYCLNNPPQWLDAELITSHLARHLTSHLGASASKFRIEILDSTPSTNTLMLQRAMQGAAHGTVLAAEWQSSGRGRMGKTWHSALGNALTFSLLWRFESGLSSLAGLSLAAGVALIRALHSFGIDQVKLKWPNDVLSEERKVAGILIEAQGDMLGPSTVVIGIGLNLSLPPTLLPQLGQAVTALSDLVAEADVAMPERNALLAKILLELQNVLQTFSAHGFAALRTEWEGYHAWQNKNVLVVLPDGSHASGLAVGVTDQGALILERGQETRIFHTGETSLRLAQDVAD